MDIIRERVKITPEVFVQLQRNSYVDWAVFRSEESLPFVPENTKKDLVSGKTAAWFHDTYHRTKIMGDVDSLVYCNSACFYQIPETIHKMKANRVVFRIKLPNNSIIMLWNSENKKYDIRETKAQNTFLNRSNDFLNLAKRHKLIPDYVPNSPIMADNTSLIVLDVSNYTPAQLYLYLCTARYVQEYPMTVWTTLDLVEKYGMNFYLAFTLAHLTRSTSLGHCVFEISGPYGAVYNETNIDNVIVDVSHSMALAKFARDPHKYGSGLVTSPKSGTSFNLQITFRNIAAEIFKTAYSSRSFSEYTYVKAAEVRTQDLFDEDVVAAIMAESNEESKKHFDNFKKKNITYVQEIPKTKSIKPVKKMVKKIKTLEAN